MHKTRSIVLALLIVLTLLSAMVSNGAKTYTTLGLIIGLAVLKFIGVSFHFMELKRANVFWKGSILMLLALFSTALIIII